VGRNRYLAALLLVVAFAMCVETISCKREPGSEQRSAVSYADIKIGYPPIAEQERRMGKFRPVLEQSTPLERPYEGLRRMVEEVPLQYVASRLESMGRATSAAGKPNVHLLLGKIEEVRNLYEDATFAVYVDKLREMGDVDGLCVAMCGCRTEPMRAKAADALACLGDPKAVKVLAIQALGTACLAPGGTEGRILREQLRRSLVKALSSCTGLHFSGYDGSEAATLEVVKRCQDWLEESGK